ncbi:hypothetical protein [Mycolicibacterium wolinskyi]|uniref:hypothetical protein n=1 Tax=Mycolicibacterium wolinskyi TaxID=59750 RepID=UPI0008311574|nr:hypothetical protein [Mycolicibacterium wolinskyi]
MALKPYITTGAALLSAAAVVAATPSLFVPNEEVAIAAPSAAPAPTTNKLSVEQYNLLAFSLAGAWDAFFEGYGGYYYQGVVQEVDENGEKVWKTDENGEFVLDEDGNKIPVYVPDPGNCSATGAVCLEGFTGLAYYASNELLPLGPIDDIFFEAGFTEFARIASVTVAATIDALDPTGRLDLTRRVEDLFAGGAALVVQNLINDNLPDTPLGEWTKGLNNAFFEEGVVGAFNYVVGNPFEVPDEEESSLVSTLVANVEGAEETSTEDPGVAKLNLGKLVSLKAEPETTPEATPADKVVEEAETPAETVKENVENAAATVQENIEKTTAAVQEQVDKTATAVEETTNEIQKTAEERRAKFQARVAERREKVRESLGLSSPKDSESESATSGSETKDTATKDADTKDAGSKESKPEKKTEKKADTKKAEKKSDSGDE